MCRRNWHQGMVFAAHESADEKSHSGSTENLLQEAPVDFLAESTSALFVVKGFSFLNLKRQGSPVPALHKQALDTDLAVENLCKNCWWLSSSCFCHSFCCVAFCGWLWPLRGELCLSGNEPHHRGL